MPSKLAQSLHIKPSQLYVHDLAKITRYYSDIVGLDILEKTSARVLLGFGETPVIELVAKPKLELAGLPSAGLFHNAILFKSRAHLSRTVANVIAQAPESFEGTGDHLVSEAFYFHDPEYNGLELYYDRPKDTWEWENGRIKMDTLYIDPNDYIERYTSGQGEADKAIGHVHLRVGDIAKGREFYVDQLGFDITADIGSALFVSVGGYHHHIGMNTWMSNGAGMRSPSLGLAEVTLRLHEESDVNNLAQRLESDNLAFSYNHGKLHIADPWGNQLVFSAE